MALLKSRGPGAGGTAELKPGPQRLLRALARMDTVGLTPVQLARLTHLRPGGRTVKDRIRWMLRSGLARAGDDGRLYITEAGLAVAGAVPPPPGTFDEVAQLWHGALPPAARQMLHAVLARHPEPVPHAELADSAGTSDLALLRNCGLIRLSGEEVTLGEAFAAVIR